jgi:hypothetical protein
MRATVSLNAVCCVLTILLTSCGNSNEIILGERSDKLIYDCSNFQPSAETPQQIAVLMQAYAQTLVHAAQNQNLVTLEALQAAEKHSDWRTMERLIVEYRCSHKKDFKK